MQLGLDDPLALVEAINEFFQLLFFYHGSTRIFGTTDISVDSWQEDEEWGRKTVLSRLTFLTEQWVWSDGVALRASSTATPSPGRSAALSGQWNHYS